MVSYTRLPHITPQGNSLVLRGYCNTDTKNWPLENSKEPTGNRTRYLPCCAAMPQPTAPPLAPLKFVDTILVIIGQDNGHFKRLSGPDSSVGIASGYGLDRPGIESRWGRDFRHLSRPAPGPTQPPIQLLPGLSRG